MSVQATSCPACGRQGLFVTLAPLGVLAVLILDLAIAAAWERKASWFRRRPR
jgi:hypothetical protein